VRLLRYAGLAVLVLGTGFGIGLGLADAPSGQHPDGVTFRGHEMFSGCFAPWIEATVTLNSEVLSRTDHLDVTVVARKVAPAYIPCTYGVPVRGGGLKVGLCGTIPLAVLTWDWRQVWPAEYQYFDCPKTRFRTRTFGFNQRVEATGSWNLRLPDGAQPPSGRYIVEVGTIAFPIVIGLPASALRGSPVAFGPNERHPLPLGGPMPKPIMVPSVIGDTEAEAKAVLAEVGLNVYVLHLSAAQSPTSAAPGTVLYEHPVPGGYIEPGGTVNLALSSGPAG
jgi:hypothetical protein